MFVGFCANLSWNLLSEKPVVVNYPTGLTFVLGNYTKDIQLTYDKFIILYVDSLQSICRCDAVGGNPVSRFWLKDGNTLVGETSHQYSIASYAALIWLKMCHICVF